MKPGRIVLIFLMAAAPGFLPAQDADPVLRAMKDELARSRQLRIVSLDAPYFIEYRVEDTVSHSIAATLGALIASDAASARTEQTASLDIAMIYLPDPFAAKKKWALRMPGLAGLFAASI